MADSTQPIEPPPPTNRELPRLRIHHFLIWTALTAAIISGCMTFDRSARNGSPIESRVIITGLVLGAVAIAGALTIVGSGIYWRRHGIAFPQSPGDWLMMIIAASVAVFCGELAGFLTIFLLFGDDDWFTAYYIVAGAIAIVIWLFMSYIVRRYGDTTAWRIAFVAFTYGPIGLWISFGTVVTAVIACVLWAAWSDCRKRIERHWTHWCGVGFAISLCISLLCVFGF